MLEPKRPAPDDEDGEQAALGLLASGKLEIEGRLVDASNATLYCTISTNGRAPRAQGNQRAARVAAAAGRLPGEIACVY